MIDTIELVPDFACDCCMLNVDLCICPACPVCETHGDPNCYAARTPYFSPEDNHGMKYSPQQIINQLTMVAFILLNRQMSSLGELNYKDSI